MTIYILVVLAFLSHIAFAGSRLLVPLYAIDQGATPFVVGTFASLYAVFPLFLAVPAGRAIDRVGYKLPLVAGTIGMLVALAACWLLPGLATLYFTVAVLGASFMLMQLAPQTIAGAIAKPEERTRNFSILALGYASANFVGPLVAGFLIDNVGHENTFGALALPLIPLLVVVLFSSRWLPRPGHASRTGTRGTSVFDLLRIKILRDTLIASSIVSGSWDVYNFFMPVYARAHGLSATSIGVIMSTFAVAIILVRTILPVAARRLGEARLISTAMIVACLAFALFPFFQTLWPLAAISFLLGLGCGCGQPIAMTLLFNATPPGRGGETTAMRITANQLVHTCIPLVFGALGTTVGYAAIFVTNSGCLGGGAWMAWRNLPRRRQKAVPKP